MKKIINLFNNKKILLALIITITIFFVMVAAFFSLKKTPQKPPKTKQGRVIGFLPYWNIEKAEIDFSTFDQIIYSGLTIDESGKIIKEEETGGIEPGWLRYKNGALDKIIQQCKNNNVKIIISITCFDNQTIPEFISNQQAHLQLIEQLVELIEEKDFDGIDIDFEYFPDREPHPDFADNFNSFLEKLSGRLQETNPNLLLSADIYPKAFITEKPYNLTEMIPLVDQIVLMAYDFTQAGSPQAGPIAPLSVNNFKEYSIEQTLEAIQKTTDNTKKIILGIPLYGYVWQTYDDQHRSTAFAGSGATISYQKIKEYLQEKEGIAVNWDATASSPWAHYQEDNQNWQIYYENLRSMQKKFQLAVDKNLGGIAFWALGYEGDSLEIWGTLNKVIYQ